MSQRGQICRFVSRACCPSGTDILSDLVSFDLLTLERSNDITRRPFNPRVIFIVVLFR
jgi:hypothetical protein